MILLIDNYDSFTYNLYHVLIACDADVQVVRNDAMSTNEVFSTIPSLRGIVISPGPGRPAQSGICLDLIKEVSRLSIPLLGVCLGHQVIAQFFGAPIVHAPKIMHGKVSSIIHEGDSLFEGVSSSFEGTRYHSLVVDSSQLPDCLLVTARSSDDQQIMALRHKELPIFGLQFHPESIASPSGPRLIDNFLKMNCLTKEQEILQ